MRILPSLLLCALLTPVPAPASEAQVAVASDPQRLQLASRTGELILKVPDYELARQRVLTTAKQQGAVVLGARMRVNYQGKREGALRLRTAADRLPGLLQALRGAGQVYAENVSASEHLAEYVELGRRVALNRERQQRLAQLLHSRDRTGEGLNAQERLEQAGIDAARLAGRRTNLERDARVSTLVVRLFEPEPRQGPDWGNWYAGAAVRARSALFGVLARGVTIGAFALYFAQLWLPLAAVLALVARNWHPAWVRARGVAHRRSSHQPSTPP